jgi:hypothetical protein
LKVRDEITQLFDRSVLKQVLALHHDEDIEFVRREAPRYLFEVLNSGVSDRNSWLSESSTLMRAIPNAAAINNTTAASPTSSGKRKEIRPMRSRPRAMLCDALVRKIGPWLRRSRIHIP